MTIVESKNPGLVAALNRGLAVAQGSFIARLDADDLMLSSRLQRQFDYLNSNDDVVVLGSEVIEIDQFGKSIGLRKYPTSKESMKIALQKQCTIAHPSTMFRRNNVLEIGGYRTFFEHAEDYDLWLRLIHYGGVVSLDFPLTMYRIHPEQISNSQQRIRVFGSYSVRINSYLGRHNHPDLIAKYANFQSWQESFFGRHLMKYLTFRLWLSKKLSESSKNNELSLIDKIIFSFILNKIKALKSRYLQ
jgi:glycosyltransferase involved in cell wall biosynthesis